MPATQRHVTIACTALVALAAPVFALAGWGEGPPAMGAPGFDPPPPPAWASGPLPPPWRPGAPYGAPAGSPPQARTPVLDQTAPLQAPEPPPMGDARRPYPLAHRPLRPRITREADAAGYRIRIDLGGLNPEDLRITPGRQGLIIHYRTDAQQFQEDRFDDGRGVRYAYSASHGALRQRIGLPPDADLARMQRDLSAGTLTLRIPRTPWRGFGPPGPGTGPIRLPGTIPAPTPAGPSR